MTVEQYLKQKFGLSRRQISSLKFRPEGIRVNGSRQRISRILHAGEWLELQLESERRRETQESSCGKQPYRGPEPLALYEDEDMLIVDKPAGLVCHPAHGHFGDTLADWAASCAERRGEKWDVRLVGRLDKDTSGIVVMAKNTEAAALLSRQREKGRMRKTYLALTEGIPEPRSGCLELPIRKEEGSLMKMKAGQGGLPARTWYQVLDAAHGHALLKLWLEHGRTHQIRVHMAAIGCPLVDDPLYGQGKNGRSAKLHAWKLQLEQPFSGERLRITAALPEWCESLRVKEKG